MISVTSKMTREAILKLNDFPNGFVKGVVDIKQEIVAIDADMHYELADFLKENEGSEDIDMWGFNLWLEENEPEDVIEYDSLINIHNNQLHGFMRAGMNIMDKDIEDKATEVILKWIQL